MIMTVVVGVVLLATVLFPIVTDIQPATAEPTTRVNEASEYLSLSEGDVDLEIADGVLTLNGEIYTPNGANDAVIFATDYFIIQYNGANYYGSYIDPQYPGIRNIDTAVVSVTDHKLTGTVGYNGVAEPLSVSDVPVSFSLYVDPSGDWARFPPASVQPYVSSVKDVIACGTYYTGDNDTFYWYYNGEADGTNSDYAYGFEATLTLVDGTTDIYTLSDAVYSVNGDTDESFTPFNMFVKKTINGHSESGAAYDLVGIIPILVVVGFILGIIGVFISRREY